MGGKEVSNTAYAALGTLLPIGDELKSDGSPPCKECPGFQTCLLGTDQGYTEINDASRLQATFRSVRASRTREIVLGSSLDNSKVHDTAQLG